jgi:hypothetical protein
VLDITRSKSWGNVNKRLGVFNLAKDENGKNLRVGGVL